ncbi:uncharacterized protein LOC107013440 [Solanum pennellii]|uniref:Uncharacterized protein LOC107013440 n=1 Tax=Solanum pennellii TaxID=28526 RepID=A0ABM1GBT2_SOLPN|nr:uncharacterized protein LOC107013440 [Solanum pennellii]
MSNLSKLEFVALDISGKNYLLWVLDAEIHLAAFGLDATITPENEASSQDKAKAMIFLRHHLDEVLNIKYLTVKDPLELWTDLKGRYDYLKLILCGETIKDEDMLEKTLTTFHASNVILQQQYREKDFQKCSELISCLLVAEQHNALLMKNHEARPTGATPLPEVNVVGARDQSEKGNKSGASFSNARAESHMTLTHDDKPGTSQKYDKDVEANLALKDDIFDGLGDITHMEVVDFFGDRN